MNIIDVTLRDGGHQVDFDWPDDFAKLHINNSIKSPTVDFVELGYWKQTAKSRNRFYNLNEQSLEELNSGDHSYSNYSLMVDCHYCSHDISDYPSKENIGIGLVRVCSRSEDIHKSCLLAERIKLRTGAKISLNFFNITNYSHNQLNQCISSASQSGADFIYFADTHGTLDLMKEFNKYRDLASIVRSYGIAAGFHLHDHSGKAYFNYRLLSSAGFDSTDASLGGMGKGDGNLRLEHIINPIESCDLLQELIVYKDFLQMHPSPYGIISSAFSITDYYALQAQKTSMPLEKFCSKASLIKGIDKDNFNSHCLSD